MLNWHSIKFNTHSWFLKKKSTQKSQKQENIFLVTFIQRKYVQHTQNIQENQLHSFETMRVEYYDTVLFSSYHKVKRATKSYQSFQFLRFPRILPQSSLTRLIKIIPHHGRGGVRLPVTPTKCLRARVSLNPGSAEPVITSKEVQQTPTTSAISCGFLPHLIMTTLRGVG